MTATSGNAGWDPGCWWQKNNSDGSKDTSRSPIFLGNWKRSLHLRRLSNGRRRRRVSYARAATFHGKSGDPVTYLFPIEAGIDGCRVGMKTSPCMVNRKIRSDPLI